MDALAEYAETFSKPGPDDNEEVEKLVVDHLPSFVYYTTYGNLDTEIYLPHVIQDLKRTDLTRKAEARARTLPVKLLFPLVFLVLPAFGLLTLAPAIISALHRF